MSRYGQRLNKLRHLSICRCFFLQNVINQFTSVAEHPRCRFIGNVEVGVHISVNKLQQFYDGIVYVSYYQRTAGFLGAGSTFQITF